jgi:hypothetical protein
MSVTNLYGRILDFLAELLSVINDDDGDDDVV